MHNTKKSKQLGSMQKPPIHDRLGPCKMDAPCYDYIPLKVSRSDVLQKVESLGILEKLAKVLSPPEKQNKAKFYQLHKYHGHDTKQCNELKKEIEHAMRNGN